MVIAIMEILIAPIITITGIPIEITAVTGMTIILGDEMKGRASPTR
jgi:uncharacterized membrane protein YvlD (DUF360 family)